MFSGIVETQSRILAARRERDLVRIDVARPREFDDIRIGDSICTNGVCLTIEAFDSERMTFALGDETLRVTGWSENSLQGSTVNLERSLKFGDRIHGHMVSGHVDGLGVVSSIEDAGGSWIVHVTMPTELVRYVWKKGSVAVNGVSLTVNSVDGRDFSVCLIPETLKRTTLSKLKAGDRVNLEIDFMARGVVAAVEAMAAQREVDTRSEV